MSDTIILSKLAKVETDLQTSNSSENRLTFLYKNQKCILLDEFKDDATNILEIIEQGKFLSLFYFLIQKF